MDLDSIRGLKQPDQRSCGPSSLVAAHILLDPAFAATQNPHAFAASVLELHRRLTAPSAFGRTQLPWPRALGTPPWAVAHAMTAYAGLPYRTRVARWGRARDFDAVLAGVTAGHPCPLYVGDRIPRHVVLAVTPSDGPSDGGVQVYNPGNGRVEEVTRTAFEAAQLTTFGRWNRPWFAVVPVG